MGLEPGWAEDAVGGLTSVLKVKHTRSPEDWAWVQESPESQDGTPALPGACGNVELPFLSRTW